MDKSAVLTQINREYNLWLNYVTPLRVRYRDRIMKWNPQNKKGAKIININMIANYMDTLIASFFTNWPKCKFISRTWRVGEEEANNLNAVAEFDEREWHTQQLKYQVEQDSMFFGVWILNKTGFDKDQLINTWRAINPLSWIPDPLPTQTWQFDGKNYRFHGFCMLTNLHDVKNLYDKNLSVGSIPYIFLYLLGNEIPLKVDEIFDFATKNNLRIIYVTAHGRQDNHVKEYPEISQWLQLIEHSDYVITNSYHGTIFSILYHKKFLSIPLVGIRSRMNTRLDELLSRYNLKDRLYSNSLEQLFNEIDYSYFERINNIEKQHVREKFSQLLVK